MGATNPQVRITRRGFLECGSAVASAGLVGNAYAESVLRGGIVLDSVKPSSEPLAGKIALEEHFVLAQTIESSYAVRDLHPETRQKILDLDSGRKGVRDRVLANYLSPEPETPDLMDAHPSSFGSALVSSTASAPSLS